MSSKKLLRLKSVLELTGLSRSWVYAMIHLGQFPAPVSLGERVVAWPEAEIQKWIRSRLKLPRKLQARTNQQRLCA